MYLTYDDYTDITELELDEVVYPRLEYKARTLINALTYNRIVNEQPVREAVKYLMVELINLLISTSKSEEQTNYGTIASVSNDGVSMSFASQSATEDVTAVRATSLIRQYLANEALPDGTPLLSRWAYA